MRPLSWFNPSYVIVVLLVVHILSGVEQGMWYSLDIDGVRMATAESDSSGIVSFSFEPPPEFGEGPHTAYVAAVGTVEFDVELLGECAIVPRETEGEDP